MEKVKGINKTEDFFLLFRITFCAYILMKTTFFFQVYVELALVPHNVNNLRQHHTYRRNFITIIVLIL